MMRTPCQWLVMIDDGYWFNLLEEEHSSCILWELWLMMIMVDADDDIHMWLGKFDDETTLPMIGYDWWWFACTWLMMMGTPCQWLIMNDDGDWFNLLGEEHPSCSSLELWLMMVDDWSLACTWLMTMRTPWLVMIDDGDWFHLLEEEHPSCSWLEGKTRLTQLFLRHRGISSTPRCCQNCKT